MIYDNKEYVDCYNCHIEMDNKNLYFHFDTIYFGCDDNVIRRLKLKHIWK